MAILADEHEPEGLRGTVAELDSCFTVPQAFEGSTVSDK
jgi:hypothetical protein